MSVKVNPWVIDQQCQVIISTLYQYKHHWCGHDHPFIAFVVESESGQAEMQKAASMTRQEHACVFFQPCAKSCSVHIATDTSSTKCILCIHLLFTRSCAALRAADLDWIVGSGYSLGGYILKKNHKKQPGTMKKHEKPTWNREKPSKINLEP